MTCREFADLLARDGWRLARIRGGHHNFIHPIKSGTIVIPGEDSHVLSPGALKSALISAKLSGQSRTDGARGCFVVVIERTSSGFSAYAPDFLGCVATGTSLEAVEASMREAIAGYVEDLRNAGSPIPGPSASISYVEVSI